MLYTRISRNYKIPKTATTLRHFTSVVDLNKLSVTFVLQKHVIAVQTNEEHKLFQNHNFKHNLNSMFK